MVTTEFIQMLTQANIPDAEFEIKCMLEQLTGTRFPSALTPEQRNLLLAMIQKRIQGEPLQYLLGEWEFYGMRLFVGEGVLIPRPDTEILVDTVLQWCKHHQVKHILDLCTGSGCIALALQKHLPDVKISAVEFSEQALSYAKKNADYHHLDINFYHTDVLTSETVNLFQDNQPDVIVSNPPYLTSAEMADLQIEVQHEPTLALAGGEDGLHYYQTISAIWKQVLKPNGLLAFEIGWEQANYVESILKSHDFEKIKIIQDWEQRDRVVLGEKI